MKAFCDAFSVRKIFENFHIDCVIIDKRLTNFE